MLLPLSLLLLVFLLSSTQCFPSNHPIHLIVLSHGLMGSKGDLQNLALLLNKKSQGSALVHLSDSNSFSKTLEGIEIGGKRLAEEIREILALHSTIREISFVGNSLGGLYARWAVSELFRVEEGEKGSPEGAEKLIIGLKCSKERRNKYLVPKHFMTIATPHLGVRSFSYLEEKFYVPTFLSEIIKSFVSRLFFATGRDIFSFDAEAREDTILYKMATQEKFVGSLAAFQTRRLLANLDNDFMVPLQTAAFISSTERDSLRKMSRNIKEPKIVAKITIPQHAKKKIGEQSSKAEDTMRESLDGLGWTKVIAYFPSTLPLAHNKICCLRKNPSFLYDDLLGFRQGQFVMEETADYLLS